GDRRRDRRPARAQARRGQRGGARGPAALPDLRRGRRRHPHARGAEGDRDRLRPSGLHRGRSAQPHHQGDRPRPLLRGGDVRALRRLRADRAGDDGAEEDVSQPRLVQRPGLPGHGGADRDVHAALRGGADRRLVGPHHRAAARREDHPARRQLHRPRAAGLRPAGAALLMSAPVSNVRPPADRLLAEIADYVLAQPAPSDEAMETARWCLLDTLACGMLALAYPACTRLLGPVVPGTAIALGSRVPGTSHELDPVQGAFDLGTMVRWLDFNDTWLAAEWGHPSDNLGAILAVADYLARKAVMEGKSPPTVRDVLTGMIKAHEIQGVLALENSFNRVGLDHVILVRVASTAVVTAMLGGSVDQIVNAISNAWIDGGALRTYRHAPNTGSRKSWAAGDATSRAVRHALISLTGEMGYPSALSAKTWGFQDVLFKGKALSYPQGLGSYVMENVLFKISYPAEFHAQTAVEAAMTLHPQVANRLDQIERIVIETQEPGVRIIDKTGRLANPADRDHCIQYMVAIPLIFGRLTAADYEDNIANDARVDA